MSTPLVYVGAGTWAGASLRICNVDYQLLFTRPSTGGVARLSLVPLGMSGASTYDAVWSRCGPDYVEFGMSLPAVCTGTDKPCEDSLAVIRIAKAHCKYTGPGWYCVRACGSGSFGTLVELGDADAVDMSIEIMNGPYDTEEEGAAYCGALTCAEVPVELALDVEFRDEYAALGTVRCFINEDRTAFIGYPTTPRFLPCGQQLDNVVLRAPPGDTISALGFLTFAANFTGAAPRAILGGDDLAQWPCFYVAVTDGVASGFSADFTMPTSNLPPGSPCGGLTGTVRITGVIL